MTSARPAAVGLIVGGLLLLPSTASTQHPESQPSAVQEPQSAPPQDVLPSEPDRFYYAGLPEDSPDPVPMNWEPRSYETIHLDPTIRQPLPDDITAWVRNEYWPTVAHHLIGYDASDEVADALERALRDAGPDEIGLYSRALRALWQVDPRRVAELTAELSPAPHYLVNDALARLQRWPHPDAAYDGLVAMGFIGERWSPEYETPRGVWNNGGVQWPLRPLTVVDELQRMGAATCFDMEVGDLPIRYADLAYTLGDIDSAFPSDAGFGSSGGLGAPYQLAAWWGESVWSVEIADNGDWVQLTELLGLLNTVARHAASTTRFAMLPADGQGICVVAASASAILSLDDLDLVQIDYND